MLILITSANLNEGVLMSGLVRILRAKLLTAVIMLAVSLPGVSMAESMTARPSGMEMIADVVLVRPLMIVGTVLGAGIFIVSLPFSALGGNTVEAADTLVATPFHSAFMRCLGCGEEHF